jgi:hypothetical protein
MCSIGRTSYVPSSVGNVSIDTHLSSTNISNETESGTESSSTSTPELNLLLVMKTKTKK